MTRWSRESIIEKIREWNQSYGEPPCSADWNPSLARWRAQEWRAARYREGIWPSTNAAKRPFGGSFDAAVRAAGLAPHRSGPRRRPAGAARPDVEQRAPMAPRSVDEALVEASERVRDAERRAAALERKVEAAERRAERTEDQLDDARRRARRAGERERRARGAHERVAVASRESSLAATETVELVSADADARVRAAYDQAQAAARDTHEARRAARAAEARAADAEARAESAERLAEATRAELASGAAESAAVGAAWQAARESEARAAAAERRSRELAALVCGESRQLTANELADLRASGPSGPAVLALALRGLHGARSAGDRRALTEALGEVASAAVRWRDQL
ncbi:hypothetical protein [Candidatus Solirubrobacter pratensis]|uniref:hypothetical protein n=1 Tax=Candidatus Solirubrobacter pratensis TaxID=1298857 RepID=UPI000484948F|nr:hypothetical protein [Candidatus Solirubrobacter pratensis]